MFLNIHFSSFAQSDSITINNISFNTEKHHYGASFFKNGELVVTTNITLTHNLRNEEDHFFVLNKCKNSSCEPLKMDRSAGDFNMSSSSFSADFKFMYVTTNLPYNGLYPNGKPKPNRLTIKRGEYIEGKGWCNFVTLPFCDKEYSYGQPSVSPDGNSLYFTASIRKSKGATDIYKVSILGNNTYGQPEQLDSNVNSYAKELFPYEGLDGYLYYSAKKKEGLGRLDIYRSKILVDGTYGPSQLLPYPINSKNDDYSIIINTDSKSGYFSSNREGGKGGTDIYSFEFN